MNSIGVLGTWTRAGCRALTSAASGIDARCGELERLAAPAHEVAGARPEPRVRLLLGGRSVMQRAQLLRDDDVRTHIIILVGVEPLLELTPHGEQVIDL